MVSKRTRVFAGIAGVAVLGTIVAVSVARENRRRVKVQTEEVSRRDLTSKVSASGEVKPKRFVNVSANISGRITHLLVDEGQSVARGQVLARIDSTRLEARTRQSEAALEAARADLERTLADLELSRLAFERQKRVHEQQLVSDEVFDRAQAELKMKAAVVESQRRRIAQAQAALATIRDDLEKTTIVSPAW